MPAPRRARADDRAAASIVLRRPVQEAEEPDLRLNDLSGLRHRGHVPGHGSAPEARLKSVEAGGLQGTELRDLLGLVGVERPPNDRVDRGPGWRRIWVRRGTLLAIIEDWFPLIGLACGRGLGDQGRGCATPGVPKLSPPGSRQGLPLRRFATRTPTAPLPGTGDWTMSKSGSRYKACHLSAIAGCLVGRLFGCAPPHQP